MGLAFGYSPKELGVNKHLTQPVLQSVIPAEAGIHQFQEIDSRLRGNNNRECWAFCYSGIRDLKEKMYARMGNYTGLIDEVKRQADRNSINKVTRVQVALGKKSDITEYALKACFKVLAKDTILSKARLQIKKTPDHKIIVNTIEGKQTEPPVRGTE